MHAMISIQIALAYAIHEKNEIRAHAEWSNTKYEKKYKPKTIILLDEHGNSKGFGLNAKNTCVKNTF